MDDFAKVFSKMLNIMTVFAVLGVLALLGAIALGGYFLLK